MKRPQDPIGPFRSLADIFRLRAARQPDRWCYSFLKDGESDEVRVTYGEVHAHASAVGALIARHAKPGDRAVLLFPPGLDFIFAFIGCAYADVVAVPMPPPHRLRFARALPQLQAVVEDSGATLALTTSALRDPGALSTGVALPRLRWIATEQPEPASTELTPTRQGGDLAFLQYTSGATGRPKAVMVSHDNLLANQAMIARAFDSGPDSIGVGWLPFHHDMGLIGNVLHPPYAGYPVTLLPPLAVLQRPHRWLAAISQRKATVSGGPDFAFDLCARRVSAADADALDLSHWKIAFSGAEAVRAATLDRFALTFAGCGFQRSAFYPCYGLAEATLLVTGATAARDPLVRPGQAGTPRVSCGGPFLQERVRVVDPQTRRVCAAGKVGEIWVSGPNVALGYWHQPEETKQVFDAHGSDGSGPWLRTGDLGWMEDGELFIDGRIKDVLIVRGKNHHPQDIELTVETASAAIRPSSVVAFALETDSGEELAVAAELEPRTSETHAHIARVLRSALVEVHGLVPAALALVPRGALPRTTSGKLRRRAAAMAFNEGSLEMLAVFRAGSF